MREVDALIGLDMHTCVSEVGHVGKSGGLPLKYLEARYTELKKRKKTPGQLTTNTPVPTCLMYTRFWWIRLQKFQCIVA
jgi:hypothetical protein